MRFKCEDGMVTSQNVENLWTKQCVDNCHNVREVRKKKLGNPVYKIFFSVSEIGRQMALPLQFFKVFSSMKIFKFLQGLVGFGNLRFAEIKSCPSASPTYELRKVEISCQK